jgi:IclR family acetate operon transcriptional repressor
LRTMQQTVLSPCLLVEQICRLHRREAGGHLTADRVSSIQSVQRAVAILKAFTMDRPELRVNELSRMLGLHKSTVSRLLSTLEQGGLVEQNLETEKFRLGVGLICLAGLVVTYKDVRRAADPYLRQLAETSRETVNLAIKDGGQVVNVEHVPSPHVVKDLGWVGRRTEMHCTSTGKVLLAHLSKEELESHLARELPSFTDKTITDPTQLRQELRKIREQGYAVAQEELEEGLNAIAAPIRDHGGTVIAAVSVSGPSYRVSPPRFPTLVEAVKQAAKNTSRELGCLDE